MPKRKSSPRSVPGVDKQLIELRLSDTEKAILDLHDNKKMTFEQIGRELGIAQSRQAIQQAYYRAKQRRWRLEARERWAGRLADCPIVEAPLPARAQAALVNAGYKRLGELVGERFVGIPYLAKAGVKHVRDLLRQWNITDRNIFCVSCGAALGRKSGARNTGAVRCSRCKSEFSFKVRKQKAAA
jgi:hypothetical protein